MKKILLGVLFILLVLQADSADLSSYIDEGKHPDPASFRGITWGQHLSGIKGMKPAGLFAIYEKKSSLNSYIREKDDPAIGYGKAEDIIYLFWQDRFFGVIINSLGSSNRDEFEKAVTKWIGKPTIRKDMPAVLYMEWQRENTRVILEYRKTALARKQDVNLSIISREMEALFMGF
ncbi:MAG TPA: hypothetical protein PKN36_10885 [bacterium]|nr:hypothetical protein [bacterium]